MPRRACYSTALDFAAYMVGASNAATLAANNTDLILRTLQGASERIDRYSGNRTYGPVLGTRTYDVWLQPVSAGVYRVEGPQGVGGGFGDITVAGDSGGLTDAVLTRYGQWTEWLWPDGPGSGAEMDLKAWLQAATAVTVTPLDGSSSASALTAGAANDYELREPTGPAAIVLSGDPVPSGVIRLTAQRASQMIGTPYRLAITGTWGYLDERKISGATIGTAGLNTTSESVALTAGGGVKLLAGQTLWVGTEQMFLHSIATDTLTVDRGVNGTTAATHASGDVIKIAQYPFDVEWVCREIADARFPANILIGVETIEQTAQPNRAPQRSETDILARLDSMLRPEEEAALVHGFA